MRHGWRWVVAALLVALPVLTYAAAPTLTQGLPALTLHTAKNGSETWSLSLQVLAAMTALTLLPAVLLMMTSFTRIIVVLGFMREGLGTQSEPSNQVLLGLALFLTLFVMSPVLNRAYSQGLQPYMNGQLTATQALPKVAAPFRTFMLDQTRRADLDLFSRLAHTGPYKSLADVPFDVVVPAFVTSELKTAFEMGFLLLVPFLIIDLVVASVLMSLGMMMVAPSLISLPFKILLFVMVDGWTLLLGTLAGSFVR